MHLQVPVPKNQRIISNHSTGKGPQEIFIQLSQKVCFLNNYTTPKALLCNIVSGQSKVFGNISSRAFVLSSIMKKMNKWMSPFLFLWDLAALSFEGFLSGKGRMGPSLNSFGKETPHDTGLCLKPDTDSPSLQFSNAVPGTFPSLSDRKEGTLDKLTQWKNSDAQNVLMKCPSG